MLDSKLKQQPLSSPAELLAGQEGFEPPTTGFGVRRSTVRATGLHAIPVKAAQDRLLFCLLNTRAFLKGSKILIRKDAQASLWINLNPA
jgi:hypothetical protein